MIHLKTIILKATYRDSAVLMNIASQLRQREEVNEVALFMGTLANLEILKQSGFSDSAIQSANVNDLIISVKAVTKAAADEAALQAQDRIQNKSQEFDDNSEITIQPLTLENAIRHMPNANLVSLSIPGEYVLREGLTSLRNNLNLFIFSDNVPVEEEVTLKDLALEKGALCMGPDCGTAYINSHGLGFYNVTNRGRIGLVAASGTGLQVVVSQLHNLGEGITHGIGVGGRDLSQTVSGRMTLFALEVLKDDPATEAIILISKPPAQEVLEKIERALEQINKPVVICCLGAEPPKESKAVWVNYLPEAAEAAVAALEGKVWCPEELNVAELISKHGLNEKNFASSPILGLYSGGTLAYETILVLEKTLGEKITSNLTQENSASQHSIFDLGDDQYTTGRPHPMIDPTTRVQTLLQKRDELEGSILLFDVVLGEGSAEDPASPMADTIKSLQEDRINFLCLAAIVGTDLDPQDIVMQKKILEGAGVHVFESNLHAARVAARLTGEK